MSGSIEFDGKDIDEALARAEAAVGRRLGAEEYAVLDRGRRGFLGIGGRQAIIRLRRIAPTPAQEAGSTVERGSALRWSGQTPAPIAMLEGRVETRHEAIRRVAGAILEAMELHVSARLRERDETIVLEIGGRDAGHLLDRDGEGLEALQYLINRILAKDPQFDRRVVVDCEGYRARRDQALVARAERLAQQVRATGRTAHLDGLNPYERRLVHVTLSSDERVRTYSTEGGDGRRLVIEPLGRPPAGGPGPTPGS